MKKLTIKLLAVIFSIIFILIFYLSVFGIKTNRLNNQISSLIKETNSELRVEIKEIKLNLDPFKLKINAKTTGPIIKFQDKNIELENIKTVISIASFIKNEYSLKNLEISTKTLNIKNLISFIRTQKNTPELYILEKIIKKGYLISDINLKFDSLGRVKDNYEIKGFIKDTELRILKKYNLDNLNLTFNFKKDNFEFNDINLDLNKIPFFSDKINVKNDKNKFLIEGSLNNKNLSLNKDLIDNFIKPLFSNIKISSLNFNSNNDFFFKLSKKLRISDLQFSSKTQINELKFQNNFQIKEFFPKIQNEIKIKNNLLNINFKNNRLSINGEGNIIVQTKEDKIQYKIEKDKNLYSFKTLLEVKDNPFLIDIIGYKKNQNQKTSINLEGTYLFQRQIKIDKFSLKEGNNKINLENLFLNKNFKIVNFKKFELDYLDVDKIKNEINIINEDETYLVKGTMLNVNNFIDNIIKNKNGKKKHLFSKNLNLNIKIDKVYIDQDNTIKNLIGILNFENNNMSKAQLDASFSKGKKLNFTVNTSNNEKVTTLFLDRAEPLVRRYKFIKGFRNGSLDFHSIKKGKKSSSTIKIYDFKLKELPALTKLLTLASLQGIADLLSGNGITFNEFEMNYRNKDKGLIIDEIYAIGPSISILMDGYIENDKLISLRGTLVPATTINKAIGSIPLLGKILVGGKTGEGVFGVSFKIKGPPKELETTVNPIKTLTPRFITRTLEKIKKN